MNRTAPTFTLNRSSTWSSWPKVNCELPPPVSKTTSEPAGLAEGRLDREEGEPGLLLAGDHLDLDAGPLPHGVDQLRAVRGGAHAGGADGGDPLDAVLLRLLDHPGDRVGRPRGSARGSSAAAVVEALAQPGHLGPVDDGAPRAVGCALADVELHRVRADVDHRVAAHAEARERLQPTGEARVRQVGEAELADRGGHRVCVLRLDRDRARVADVGAEIGQLAHAAADRVPLPALVHADRAAGPG